MLRSIGVITAGILILTVGFKWAIVIMCILLIPVAIFGGVVGLVKSDDGKKCKCN